MVYNFDVLSHLQVHLLLILWYTKFFCVWGTIDTFSILGYLLVDILLILGDTKYFRGQFTVDTLRYQVFRSYSTYLYCPYPILARADTAQYPVFQHLILTILHTKSEETKHQTRSTFPIPSLSLLFIVHFFFFGGIMLPFCIRYFCIYSTQPIEILSIA